MEILAGKSRSPSLCSVLIIDSGFPQWLQPSFRAQLPPSAWSGGGGQRSVCFFLAAVGAPPAPTGSAGSGGVGCQMRGLVGTLPLPVPGPALRVPCWAGVPMGYAKFCTVLGIGMNQQLALHLRMQPKPGSLNCSAGKGWLGITGRYNPHCQRIPSAAPTSARHLCLSVAHSGEGAAAQGKQRCARPIASGRRRSGQISCPRGTAAGSTQQPFGRSRRRCESKPALAC